MTARLGLGTYRCRDVRRDAMMAASLGADWVDTAPNYAHGQAENALAPVLVRHPDLKVSTKVGFVPADTGRIAVRAGMLTPEDARRGHCLTPGYIAWQVTRSARRLGRAPDIVFVHNPEHDCPPDAVTERLYAAFLALEEACNQGVIKAYGVATWQGFGTGLFDVADLVALAVRAGGLNHHLRSIQLPVSVVHLAPVGLALDGLGVLVEAASAGLEVFASAPLHGGEIPDMIGPELAELIAPGSTPAEAALSVVASAPGISRVLLSTGNPQHWSRAADAVGRAPLSQDLLRKVTDVLGT